MSNLSDVMYFPVQIPKIIPNNWMWKSLVEICRPKQWKTISNSELVKAGYPVFGANGFIGFFHTYNHESDTIAITCRGATCGTINLVPPKTYITGNSMCLDDLNSVVIKKYVFYATQFRTLSDVISGSAQPQITGEGLKKVILPIPPLPEQKKIASILTSVDEVIERTQKQIGKLQDLKKATMNELLTKGIGHTEFKDSELGRIPKSWEVMKVSGCIDRFQNGYAFSSSGYCYEGMPILSIVNISLDGKYKFDVKSEKKWPEEEAKVLERFHVKKGDLIVAMTDVTPNMAIIGRGAIVTREAASLLNQRVGILRVKKNIDPTFLSYVFNCHYWRNYSKISASLGAQANIGIKDILSGEVKLPSKEEQKEVVRVLTSLDHCIEEKSRKIVQTQSLKKSLMQDLLTGKVRVKVD